MGYLQTIPLDNLHNQTFQTTIAIDGANRTFEFFIRWNELAGYWTMRITDPATDTILLDSIPLVTGQSPAHNLLGQYAYMKIGSAYLINTGANPLEDPTEDDIGINFTLVWGDTPDR
jgi:hypothetical protein